MKIAEYNQMMAYLTRPEPLPQPKPEELLDLQEQKRKDRLRKTMDEASPFLMDESVDFIERENFAIKGLTDQQLIDLGFSTGSNLQPQKQSYKKLAEIFQQELPPGVLNVISGYGEECGGPLTTHEKVKKVTFESCQNVGKS